MGQMARLLANSTLPVDFRDSILGLDPRNIELIWHHLYRRFTGGGGFKNKAALDNPEALELFKDLAELRT